jgi:hypothetical protein
VGNHEQFWSVQGVMSEGDLVRLKTRYPIWLYSYGLTDGDLGIVAEIGEEDTLVYWLRIRKQGSVKNNLLELVELETK